ncbi:MAG TPA: hypothetical protein VIS48_05525 [Candidatus Kryptonia bacterium]
MKTVLIQEKERGVENDWASYLSQRGFVVFTTADSLETAEIVSAINIGAIVVSSSDPGSLLLLGKVLKLRNQYARIVVVSTLDPATLSILVEAENLVVLEAPFTFSKLTGAVAGARSTSEVPQDVLVQG